MDYYETRDSRAELGGTSKIIDFEKSVIRKTLRGANVFITGGAGFLGCLLVEKIARSCPDFGKIYLLLRPKRGLTPAERLEQLFESEVYHLLKKSNPDFISRIFLMEGDLNEPMCGLSLENQNIIKEEVNFIYHIAASLRMTEPLLSAYQMNVRALKDLLDLSTEMKCLQGFLYVSTAYSNCFRPDISELFYTTTYNWEDVKIMTETMSEEQLTYFTPQVVGRWINTYAFTKAVAEDLVKSYIHKIPLAIARPSIVVGCKSEPLVGWINNVYGATGVSAGAAVGLIRVWFADPIKVADIIPADYVVNTMIAITWQLAKNHREKIQLENPIFNIVSSPKAPTTWGSYMTTQFKNTYESKVTTVKTIGEYYLKVTSKKWLYFTLFFLLHLTQGIIIDTFLVLKGKPAMLMKSYIKIMRFNMQLAFFGEREWKYEQNNVDNLLKQLPEEDKAIFPFDMGSFSWGEYYVTSIRAILKYIVKSKDSEHPKRAREKYFRFVEGRRFITRMVIIFMWWKVFNICNQFITPAIIGFFRV